MFGAERDVRDVLSDDVALAAEQHGIEYYPGLVTCPECENDAVVMSGDNEPFLIKLDLEDFEEFVLMLIEETRLRMDA